MDDVTTSETPLIVTLRALDKEWQSDNWPHDDEPRPRSYYAVAADRVETLEMELRETLRAVLHHFGPDGANKVTAHVIAEKAKA